MQNKSLNICFPVPHVSSSLNDVAVVFAVDDHGQASQLFCDQWEECFIYVVVVCLCHAFEFLINFNAVQCFKVKLTCFSPFCLYLILISLISIIYIYICSYSNVFHKKLPKYASCCFGSSVGGRIVGMPGMNVLSFSVPPQRDFLRLLRSVSSSIYINKCNNKILFLFNVHTFLGKQLTRNFCWSIAG